eukprot:TRINITY_DN48241_c0_g1_i1.p1 TRINITY_DN48241_c0_g1~~TRINITY_DN48241_c0_g1_i1.p1  ORF type:complete len:171 (+),score=26.11 TRINITY_DN48241_c0_g1_i1:40-513(+)
MVTRIRHTSKNSLVVVMFASMCTSSADGQSCRSTSQADVWANTMEETARRYYTSFNDHDLNGLKEFFKSDSELEDKGNGHLIGFDAVIGAHDGVLKALPNIHFNIVKMHRSPSSNTLVVELRAQKDPSKDPDDVIRIADVLEFYDDEPKIKFLRAYD